MKLSWRTYLVLFLVAVALFFYGLNYIIFGEASDIVNALTLSLGFVPIWTILITLVLNQLLAHREKQTKLSKIKILIGCFFSEFGTTLLKSLPDFDPNKQQLSQRLILTDRWVKKDFIAASRYARTYDYIVQINLDKLEDLKKLLIEKRTFLLWLLDNPSLLEHESFSNLMMAVFHLTDELSYRSDLRNLPDTDYTHLIGDIKRVYASLFSEWIEYMQYQKDSYPYFYSLSMRINPLNPNAAPEVAY